MNSIVLNRSLLLASLLLMLFSHEAASARKPAYEIPPDQMKIIEKRHQEWRDEKNTAMLLWGKVVDFDGNPVPDAEVTMRRSVVPATVFGDDQINVTTTTDADGRFSFEHTGFLYYLVDIKREGYQFRMEYIKDKSLEFRKRVKHAGKGYEKDKPMTFRIRKLASSAYLTSRNWEFGLKDGMEQFLDLYEHIWTEPDDHFTMRMSRPYWHPDVRFRLEKRGDHFVLHIEALDEGAGFLQVEDVEFFEELTEAPNEGYMPSLEVKIREGKGKRHALYIKSEDGLFYSRMWITFRSHKDYDGVIVNVSEATNPTGETILENDHERYRQRSRDSDAGKYWKLSRELLRKGELYIPQPEPKP